MSTSEELFCNFNGLQRVYKLRKEDPKFGRRPKNISKVVIEINGLCTQPTAVNVFMKGCKDGIFENFSSSLDFIWHDYHTQDSIYKLEADLNSSNLNFDVALPTASNIPASLSSPSTTPHPLEETPTNGSLLSQPSLGNMESKGKQKKRRFNLYGIFLEVLISISQSRIITCQSKRFQVYPFDVWSERDKNERVKCACGGSYIKDGTSRGEVSHFRHLKSGRHLGWIKQSTIDEAIASSSTFTHDTIPTTLPSLDPTTFPTPPYYLYYMAPSYLTPNSSSPNGFPAFPTTLPPLIPFSSPLPDSFATTATLIPTLSTSTSPSNSQVISTSLPIGLALTPFPTPTTTSSTSSESTTPHLNFVLSSSPTPVTIDGTTTNQSLPTPIFFTTATPPISNSSDSSLASTSSLFSHLAPSISSGSSAISPKSQPKSQLPESTAKSSTPPPLVSAPPVPPSIPNPPLPSPSSDLPLPCPPPIFNSPTLTPTIDSPPLTPIQDSNKDTLVHLDTSTTHSITSSSNSDCQSPKKRRKKFISEKTTTTTTSSFLTPTRNGKNKLSLEVCLSKTNDLITTTTSSSYHQSTGDSPEDNHRSLLRETVPSKNNNGSKKRKSKETQSSQQTTKQQLQFTTTSTQETTGGRPPSLLPSSISLTASILISELSSPSSCPPTTPSTPSSVASFPSPVSELSSPITTSSVNSPPLSSTETSIPLTPSSSLSSPILTSTPSILTCMGSPSTLECLSSLASLACVRTPKKKKSKLGSDTQRPQGKGSGTGGVSKGHVKKGQIILAEDDGIIASPNPKGGLSFSFRSPGTEMASMTLLQLRGDVGRKKRSGPLIGQKRRRPWPESLSIVADVAAHLDSQQEQEKQERLLSQSTNSSDSSSAPATSPSSSSILQTSQSTSKSPPLLPCSLSFSKKQEINKKGKKKSHNSEPVQQQQRQSLPITSSAVSIKSGNENTNPNITNQKIGKNNLRKKKKGSKTKAVKASQSHGNSLNDKQNDENEDDTENENLGNKQSTPRQLTKYHLLKMNKEALLEMVDEETLQALEAEVYGVDGKNSPDSDDEENNFNQENLSHLKNRKGTGENNGGEGAVKACNCKKSRCLKNYCECFQRQEYCRDCNCVDCHNTEGKREHRDKAIEAIKERDSEAFSKGRRKGCRCKKSECQKKYCECYQAGLACSDALCVCINCGNGRTRVYTLPKTANQVKRQAKKARRRVEALIRVIKKGGIKNNKPPPKVHMATRVSLRSNKGVIATNLDSNPASTKSRQPLQQKKRQSESRPTSTKKPDHYFNSRTPLSALTSLSLTPGTLLGALDPLHSSSSLSTQTHLEPSSGSAHTQSSSSTSSNQCSSTSSSITSPSLSSISSTPPTYLIVPTNGLPSLPTLPLSSTTTTSQTSLTSPFDQPTLSLSLLPFSTTSNPLSILNYQQQQQSQQQPSQPQPSQPQPQQQPQQYEHVFCACGGKYLKGGSHPRSDVSYRKHLTTKRHLKWGGQVSGDE